MTNIVNIEGRECKCVGKHVPLPMRLYEVVINESVVHLCPTAYQNYLSYKDEHVMHKGRPPGSVRKHYSDYIQSLI